MLVTFLTSDWPGTDKHFQESYCEPVGFLPLKPRDPGKPLSLDFTIQNSANQTQVRALQMDLDRGPQSSLQTG